MKTTLINLELDAKEEGKKYYKILKSKTENEKVNCQVCGTQIKRHNLKSHQLSDTHKNNVKRKQKILLIDRNLYESDDDDSNQLHFLYVELSFNVFLLLSRELEDPNGGICFSDEEISEAGSVGQDGLSKEGRQSFCFQS